MMQFRLGTALVALTSLSVAAALIADVCRTVDPTGFVAPVLLLLTTGALAVGASLLLCPRAHVRVPDPQFLATRALAYRRR